MKHTERKGGRLQRGLLTKQRFPPNCVKSSNKAFDSELQTGNARVIQLHHLPDLIKLSPIAVALLKVDWNDKQSNESLPEIPKLAVGDAHLYEHKMIDEWLY